MRGREMPCAPTGRSGSGFEEALRKQSFQDIARCGRESQFPGTPPFRFVDLAAISYG